MDKCKDILSSIYGEYGDNINGNPIVCECFIRIGGADKRIGTVRFRSLLRAKTFAVNYTKTKSNNFCRVWEDLPLCIVNDFGKGLTFKESYRNGKCIARRY